MSTELNRRLSLVSVAKEDDTLGGRLSKIAEERRGELTIVVTRWLLHWAEFGQEYLYLDEIPGVVERDHEYIIEWLREQGVTVQVPRLWRRWGRAIIHLDSVPSVLPSEGQDPNQGR